MPDEPNKKMDELLRAYAQQRRKTPELPLHPATRQMLQGEVTRVYGKEAGGRSWWMRLRAFWPQIAFGAALSAVLVVAVLSLQQPSRQEPVADSASAPSPSATAQDRETVTISAASGPAAPAAVSVETLSTKLPEL